MCGICGIINFDQTPVDEFVITKMMVAQKHRGPDDEGFYLDQNIGLGHVRLSIIDLTCTGHQPMFSDDNRFVIIYNGEIYNYADIKKVLIAKGIQFKTNSDTEVILKAYIEWGFESLSMLRGMFAFVIYDSFAKEIIAVRDRFGIKPFYYFLDKNRFIFASEIKAILTHKDIVATLNEIMLFDFMVYNRTDHDEQTCFKNILNLRPSHYIKVDLQNRVEIKNWYKLPDIVDTLPDKELKINLFWQLQDSIKYHLVSDVSVGTALSGGLDSSGIVCLMREILGNEAKINSFSAVYDQNWSRDEKKYVEIVSDYAHLHSHFTTPTADKLIDELDKLIYHQEEPFASSSMFAGWCIMKLASENRVKVLLNGQGSDEIFSYDYMSAFYFYELIIKGKLIDLSKQVFCFLNKQQFNKLFTSKLFLFLLAPRCLKDQLIKLNQPWITPCFYEGYKDKSNFYNNFFNVKNLNESVKNHLVYKLNHLLRVEDKNAMAHSVETRVPFLDHKLVEFALTIPSDEKIHNGQVKYILKKTLSGHLPEGIIKRNNKIGFETPQDRWFREKRLAKLLDDVIYCKTGIDNYFNKQVIINGWEAHKKGKQNQHELIWKYFYLNKWYSTFF
jgi:asparagine synthase (glutamine-hydrolysing)